MILRKFLLLFPSLNDIKQYLEVTEKVLRL